MSVQSTQSNLLRKRNMFACLGLILFRLVEINSPALLKSLSDGTEVATVDRYTLATSSNEGKT